MAHAQASIGTIHYRSAIVAGRHTFAADEGPALAVVQADVHLVRDGDSQQIDRPLIIEGAMTLTLKGGLQIRATLAQRQRWPPRFFHAS